MLKLFKFVALFLGFVLLLQGVSPASASEAVQSYAAEDYLSARLQANITNHRILIISELSETSTTWVNPDGTLTTDSFGSPIRVRDSSGEFGWRDLDFTLFFDDSGFVRAQSGNYDLRISGGGTASEVRSSGLVSVSGVDGAEFGFAWDGALPKPVLSGDTARFVEVLPNVDLLVRLDASGFEQSFEVKAKPDQVTLDKLKLLVQGKDVRIVDGPSGSYQFVVGSQVLGSVPNPTIYDSADGASAPISQELSPEISTPGVLNMSVDEAFFDRPDLTYPVIVDPSVVLSPTIDTYVTNAYPTSDFQSSTELLVGTPDGGASVYRSYLNFDNTGWIGQDIISAHLKLYLNWSWSCTARNFSVYAISPVTPSTRWANAPTIGGTGVAKSVAAGYSSSCPASTIDTDVTLLAKNMPVVISNRAGFGIKASNESDSFGWKRFNSFKASTNKPTLSITYNRYPQTPSTPSITGAITVNGVLTAGSWKPALSSKAFDLDGGNVTLSFNSYADSAFSVPIGVFCSVTVASGVLGTCRPSTPLNNTQTYYVRVSANDGSANSLLQSPGLAFRVEAAQPLAPSISCPYSNGYQGGAVPTSSFDCTVSTSASTASYRAKTVSITLDNSSTQTFTASDNGSFSQSVTIPAGSFQHTITALAFSATDVSSDPKSYLMSFDQVGIISPLEPTVADGTVTISGYALNQSYNTPTYAQVYWRKMGDTGFWNSASNNLGLGTRNNLPGLYDYKLDLTSLGTSGANALPTNVPVNLDLKLCFFYVILNNSYCTNNSPVTVTRTPSEFSDRAATSAGLGEVSLTNGKFRLQESDVSQQIGLDSLNVSRVFQANQIAPTAQSQVLGTGWSLNLGSDASDASGYSVYSDATSGHYFLITPSAQVYDYTLSGGIFKAANKVTERANLKLSGSSSSFTVFQTDNSQASFTKLGSNWRATCSKGPNDNRDVITNYTSTGLISAYGYSSGSCGSGNPVTQGLQFSYSQANRLSSIYFVVNGAVEANPLVSYSYNSNGLLGSVLDGANNSSTSYEYNSLGFLSKQSISGFDPYVYKYDSSNRLVQVQRSHPGLFGDVYSTVQSFVYGVNLSDSSGKLPYLPAWQTTIWGQNVAPVYGAAVFGEDTSVSLEGSTFQPQPTDSQWRNASFEYFDVQGNLVNTADYGSSGWLYTANLLNADGTLHASFDVNGINRVLDQYAADGNANFDELMFSTVYKYATQINTFALPANTFISDSWSPIHEVTDGNGNPVSVRTHSSYSYDSGTPFYALTGFVTSQTVGLTFGEAIKTVNDVTLSSTANVYTPLDGSSPSSATSGWILGKPTVVTVSTVYNLVNVQLSKVNTYFNSLGQVVKVQKLDSTGNVLHETKTTYYSGGVDTAADKCDGHAEWADLPCEVKTGEAIPISSTWFSSYDSRLNPLVQVEYRSGVAVRTTSNSYTPDNRLLSSTVSGAGFNSIKTEHVYDPTTLLETATKLYYDGALQSSTSKAFDSWGREISSTNSFSETTTTSYVSPGTLGAGSIASISSPQTTTSFVYGSSSEARPLATAMTVSVAGLSFQYSGVYDQLGRLFSQSGPNGVTQTFSFNDSGQIASMSYASGTTWQRTYDYFGRVFQETDPTGSITSYTYDAESRLSKASSSTLSEEYGYDVYGDRTSSLINNITSTHTFNAESQLTNSGYVYDALGRNTFIPALDAPNGGSDIALSYNLVDQVTNITQGSSSTSFTYDSLGRRVNETVGGLTTVRHYTDSSDNPEWTSQLDGANSTTEIYTGSLGAGMGVTTTIKNGVTSAAMQITDMHGHTVNTINLTGTNTDYSSWASYDSFGNPISGQTKSNLINYSAYGQQERATNSTGLILMGARVYNPKTNQFTSIDPIPGGNENSYTYPNDPINQSDFTGLWDWWDTLDLALTVISILPIPIVQEIGWAAKGAYLAYRIASIEIRAINLVRKLRKAEKLGESLNTLVETSTVSARAGVRWTGSTETYLGKGGSIYHLKSPKAQYRSPDIKKSGELQSNFESGPLPNKKNKWQFDHHVTIIRGTP